MIYLYFFHLSTGSLLRIIRRGGELLGGREAVGTRRGSEGAQAGGAMPGGSRELGVQWVGGQDDMRVEEGGSGAHVPISADGAHRAGEVLGSGEGQGGRQMGGVQWEP